MIAVEMISTSCTTSRLCGSSAAAVVQVSDAQVSPAK